jgi:hypothetical protein
VELLPLCAYVPTRQGQSTGLPFIDSLSIRVCHNRCIASHKVAGLTRRAKGRVTLTSGQVDDRRPVRKLVRQLWGKLFGDRGYLSQELFEQLWEPGLQLIIKLKRNMKNKLAAVVAYTFQPKKPRLDLSTLDREPRQQLLLTAMVNLKHLSLPH